MARIRSHSELREVVSDLLRSTGVKTPPIPVDKIARRLKATVRYMPYEGELAGMVFRDDAAVIIGVNSLHHPNRQRFTIAHECGHLLFHEGKEVHIDRAFRVNLRDASSSRATDPEEIEANRFAAELLMPYDMIRKDLRDGVDIESEESIIALAKKYRVSAIAMTLRIKNFLANV